MGERVEDKRSTGPSNPFNGNLKWFVMIGATFLLGTYWPNLTDMVRSDTRVATIQQDVLVELRDVTDECSNLRDRMVTVENVLASKPRFGPGDFTREIGMHVSAEHMPLREELREVHTELGEVKGMAQTMLEMMQKYIEEQP